MKQSKSIQTWWFLWDEREGQKHDLLKRGFDKQPAGVFLRKSYDGFSSIISPFLGP